jgi:hypothetical protein
MPHGHSNGRASLRRKSPPAWTETAQDIAVYHPSFTGSHGTLDLASGEQLQLKCVNFWSTEWAVADANDNTLLICHNRGVFSQGAELEIVEEAQHRKDIPLLAYHAVVRADPLYGGCRGGLTTIGKASATAHRSFGEFLAGERGSRFARTRTKRRKSTNRVESAFDLSG